MPFAFLLALAAIAGATLLTYLYDREALLWSRLCVGVCVGFAALGVVGFVFASWLGMTPLALALAGAVCGSPLLLLFQRGLHGRFQVEVGDAMLALRRAFTRPGKRGTGEGFFYVVAALLFWLVFDRAMYQNAGGVFTGVDTNIGDLPFHIAVISGFAHGENFPPQHPEFAGVRLTYPFVVDFVTAMLVRAGATLQGAMFWQNFAMAMSLVGILHRWALKLTRERVAALVTPALVLLSGGFGWYVFIGEAWSGERGVFGLLGSLEHDYTIMGHLGYRWGNAVTALFVTQRGILLGVALALVVWTLWWDAGEKAKGKRQKAKEGSEEPAQTASVVERHRVGKKGAGGKKKTGDKSKAKDKSKGARGRTTREADEAASTDDSFAFCLLPFAFREMIAVGVIAGLLPLVHAHSFVVMMAMGACLAMLQGAFVLGWKEGASVEPEESARESVWARVWKVWRPWLAFAAVASVVAVPQMLWAMRDSGVRAGQFFGWEFGWDHGTENVAWFWIKNTGVFIPLLVAALVWRGLLVTRRLLFFYLPFTLCFVVPNVYKLSPWVWDNIKVLLYWWIASAPLVALALARLWRGRGWLRALAVALLLMQTAAGGLDVWRAASGAVERRTFDPSGVVFAEVIMRETPPRSLILHAPTYNDPVYMTGRRTFLGFTGHIWSHGLDYAAREADLKRIYAGGADALGLIAKNRIEYVVVGPLERDELKKSGVTVNENFFRQFRKVGEAGEYQLYKTQP
ncbi:MAG TPA: hypothetical protein VEX60_08895 [Pyrinomonadaceae bacterium]|nr:hypothetical protein [Pyrinomonadaceae bacterium]